MYIYIYIYIRHKHIHQVTYISLSLSIYIYIYIRAPFEELAGPSSTESSMTRRERDGLLPPERGSVVRLAWSYTMLYIYI